MIYSGPLEYSVSTFRSDLLVLGTCHIRYQHVFMYMHYILVGIVLFFSTSSYAFSMISLASSEIHYTPMSPLQQLRG